MKAFILIPLFVLTAALFCSGQKMQVVQHKQESAAFKAVKPGDNMQGYSLSNLINYPKSTASFSEFEGKLVIMEFWATTCSSCIGMWPKLLALQKQFGEKIQIVLVNSYEGEAKVRKAIEKRKRLAGVEMDLPVACADTVMGNQLFPHAGVPFVVWITKNGLVKSISASASLTPENIEAMLLEKTVKLQSYVRNDQFVRPNFKRALFVDGNANTPHQIKNYSLLSPSMPGLWPARAITKDKASGTYIATVTNFGSREMYRLAYSDGFNSNENVEELALNRIDYQLKDTNTYVYQLIAPASTAGEFQKKMQLDLQRNFGAVVHWEKQIKPCLVLTMQDSSLVAYQGRNQEAAAFVDDNELKVNRISVSRWIMLLKEATPYNSFAYPLLDETGFKGLLADINLETNIYDYKSLDQALGKYKMGLKLQDRQVNVLVVEPAVDSVLEVGAFQRP